MNNNIIGIIGLGYVGLTFSIALARKGFNVFGYENNLKTFNKLKKGKAQFYEENINTYLKQSLKSKRLKIFKNLDEIQKCKIVFITIGTPINKNKKISLEKLFNIVKELKKKLSNNTILVLRSTVKIGTTKKIEKISNTEKKIYLAMCPERTTEGSAFKEINSIPQVIGVKSKFAKNTLKKLFHKLTNTTIIFNSFEEAEILKLIDNCYRDTIFGFANELAKIGELLNINVLNVIKKIGIKYPRTKIPYPGTVGGPCLTKDSHILIESVKKKMNLGIISSSRKINEKLPIDIIGLIKKKFKRKKVKTILFCGLAFKGEPETSDIRGSMSESIIRECKKKFGNARYYSLDNFVSNEDAYNISKEMKFYNLYSKINQSFDLIIILNNNPYWKKIGLKKFVNKLTTDGIIFDFWSSFKDVEDEKKYYKLGQGKISY